MKEKYRSNKGITLISLVVTIIVLIILAGISINLIMGENGIITRAKQAKEAQETAQITESIRLQILEIMMRNEGRNVTVDELIAQLQSNPNNNITNVEPGEDENSKYITIDDKYVFLVKGDEDGNIATEYEGEAKSLKPRIENVELSSTTNTISVKVNAKRAEEYVIYIKVAGATEYIKQVKNTTGECTFENLEQNKEYTIRVEAINKNGQVEKEVNRVTGTMANLTSSEVKYTTVPSGWINNGSVTTTIELNTEQDVTGYTIQYATFTGEVTSEGLANAEWIDYTAGITSTENRTIYSRLYDGVNSTSYTSTTIGNIDKNNPTITTDLNSSNVTTKGFTLNVGVADTQSGIGKIEWYYKLSTDSDYKCEIDNYTEIEKSSNKFKTFDSLTNGTYNAYVVVYDVAGNSISTQENPITFNLSGLAVASGASGSPKRWTKGSVTITLPTQDGYTTEYQVGTLDVNGTWNTYDSSNKPKVSENTAVYYRYNDGTNAAQYASIEISNIDKTAPIIVAGSTNVYIDSDGDIRLNFICSDAASGVYIVNYIVEKVDLSWNDYYEFVIYDHDEIKQGRAEYTGNWSFYPNSADEEEGEYNAYAEIEDDAGNKSEKIYLGTVTLDKTSPELQISKNVNTYGGLTNASSITYTFKFNEDIKDFTADDITVTNGTKGTFTTVSASEYTLVVTSVADGEQTVGVAANVCTDLAGNGNTVAETHSLTIDRTAPTCTITANTDYYTRASSITYTFEFSEAVAGFTEDGITVTNGTKGTLTRVSSNKYTLVVTNTSEGTQTVKVATNACSDTAMNNLASAASKSVVIDRTSPTISTALSSSNESTTGFTLNIGLKDTSSGLDRIEFYYYNQSTGNELSVTEKLNGVKSTSVSKSITGLTAAKYAVYAEIYDVVGNTTMTTTIIVDTAKNYLSGVASVGDYVAYSIDGGDETYRSEESQNGWTSTDVNNITNLKWRILDISSNGTIKIISTESLNDHAESITVYGQKGYNNIDTILEDICYNLYGQGYGANGANVLDIYEADDYASTLHSFGIDSFATRNSFEYYWESGPYEGGYDKGILGYKYGSTASICDGPDDYSSYSNAERIILVDPGGEYARTLDIYPVVTLNKVETNGKNSSGAWTIK